MDKVSYALGIGIGRQLAQMGATDINTDDFGQAIKDAISGRLQLDEQEAQMIVQDFFQRKSEEQAKNAKAEGENFLAENGKKEGVVVLPSGLQYQVLREGNGNKPSATKWNATTRARSSTDRCSTVPTSADRRPRLVSIR